MKKERKKINKREKFELFEGNFAAVESREPLAIPERSGGRLTAQGRDVARRQTLTRSQYADGFMSDDSPGVKMSVAQVR